MLRYRLFGKTGLRVSELCLGTMTFGAKEWGSSAEESRAIYAAFREAGGNFFDAANEIYADGRSEQLLGGFAADERDAVVISTKYTHQHPGSDINASGNHRKAMARSLERSLRRLRTDYVDLLWIHAWDFTVAPDEIMRALDDQVRLGKVLHIGISNTPAWQVAQCNTLAELKGWTPFAGFQFEYSLINRTAEREIIPLCDSFGIAKLAWSVLAMGILSGKYGQAAEAPRRLDLAPFWEVTDRSQAIARTVGEVAERNGTTAAAVALSWVRRQPGLIPIIGSRTLAQMETGLAPIVALPDEDIACLEVVSAQSPGAPHDAIRGGRGSIYGGYADMIDAPPGARYAIPEDAPAGRP